MSSDLLDAAALRQASAGRLATPCTCALGACPGWESFAEDRWPGSSLHRLETLRDPAVDEPTLEAFHPDGTRYASPDVPLAVGFFPATVAMPRSASSAATPCSGTRNAAATMSTPVRAKGSWRG